MTDVEQLRSGSRWLMTSTVVIGVLNYGYALVLLRLLRAPDYTGYAAGQALLLAVGAVAQCAVPWVLAHELATARADRVRRRAAVSFAILANTVAGLAGAVITVVIATRFASVPAELAIGASVVAIFVSNTTIGWLQGECRFGLLATVMVGEVVGKIVVGLGLVAAGAGAAGALAGYGVGALFAVVVGLVVMRHDLRPVLATDRLRRSLRTTLGMTAMQGLLAAQANLDVLLVAVLPLLPAESAGYQAAALLGRIPVFVSTGLAVVLFPLLTEAGDRAAVLRAALGTYAGIAACVLAALCTAPARLVALVIPGSFTGSATLLPLLALVGASVGVVGLITAYLQALQRYRRAIPVQVGGLLAAAAGVVAGWRLAGPAGVAVGAALAAAATAIALQARSGDARRRGSPVPLGPLLPAAVLLPVLLMLRPYPVAWLLTAAVAGGGCGWMLLRARGPATGTAPVPEAPSGPAPSFRGPYLVVSPHLDDGVLSCGALLTALRDTHQVTVATVFTEAAPPPYSLSARRYLRQCGADDAGELYRRRREEDRAVLAGIGAEAVHLGLTEALFRRPDRLTRARRLAGRWLPELALTYPTYRFHIVAGRPAPADRAVARRVAREIMALVAARRPGTVFLPMGFGGHADHLITREVGARLAGLAVYYADFPYAARETPDGAFAREHGLVAVERRAGLAAKQELIRGYRSQFRSLFPDGSVPSLPERYFVPVGHLRGEVSLR